MFLSTTEDLMWFFDTEDDLSVYYCLDLRVLVTINKKEMKVIEIEIME